MECIIAVREPKSGNIQLRDLYYAANIYGNLYQELLYTCSSYCAKYLDFFINIENILDHYNLKKVSIT